MKVHAKVTPNSAGFSVEMKESILQIKCKNAPEKGKVNRELITKLQKILGASVKIMKGVASRNKILEVALNEDEIKERIKTVS